MSTAVDILAKLDAIAALVAALRTELAGAEADAKGVTSGYTPADGLADDNLLDTHSAAARFNYPTDTVRLWARQGCGKKVGGRWLVDPKKLRQRINGG